MDNSKEQSPIFTYLLDESDSNMIDVVFDQLFEMLLNVERDE